ncbi:MAG: RNA polymerase subunit sigma-70, partial [Oscillospiraceae bacterium]|nr:RNA polymerase subunit sigma-70 [Oscillospiraceae bacterium]
LSTLNSRDRSVFIRRYYYFEDISVIAENYGIKEGNVRTVLMRTRKKFRKYLEGMIR